MKIKSNGFIACFSVMACLTVMTGCANNPVHQEDKHNPKTNYQKNNLVLNCSNADGHHVIAVETTCPLGGEKFSSLEFVVYSTYGVNSDWEPQSYLHFPLPITICPSNGFVVDKKDFSPEELKNRKDYIESPEYQKIYKEGHASFYLLAKQVEALKDDNLKSLWWYYLKATWEAQNCNNAQRYTEYANLVIGEGIKRQAQLTPKDDEFWTLGIIIPEMYRRTARFNEGNTWLRKIGTPSLEKAENNDFFNLAKDLMQKALNEKSSQQFAIKKPNEKEH